MKRLISISVIFFLLVTVAGCKPKNGTPDATGSTPTTSDSPADTSSGGDANSQGNNQGNTNDSEASNPANTQKQNSVVPNPVNTQKQSDASNSVSYDAITQSNMIPLCYDLIDYMRTQGLGRSFVTSTSERQMMQTLVTNAWSGIDAASRNYLTQMAQEGQKVKNTFAGLSEKEKNTLRTTWKKTVLSPSLINAPLLNPNTYSQGGISFCYPGNWSAEPFNINNTDFLFIFKTGIQASYTDVYDMTKSPAGCLSTIIANNEGYSSGQLANILSESVTTNAPGMKVINTYDTNLGSARIINGTFPGQSEEKFMWLVIIPKDNEYIFCRMSGPVAQADTLIPAFYNMLNTLNWSTVPAGGGGSGGGGEASAAFDTAWSRVSTAVVANIWAK